MYCSKSHAMDLCLRVQGEFTFLWFIENYSYSWHENGERFSSPIFIADGLQGTSWGLWLYPRGYRDVDKGYISLLLARSGEDGGPESISVNYELSILSGNELNSRSAEDSFKRNKGFGFPKFLQMNEIFRIRKADYFQQDVLIVRCKVWKGEGIFRNVAPVCARTRIGIENITFLHVVEHFEVISNTFQAFQGFLNYPIGKKTIEIRSQSKKGCIVSSRVYCSERKIIVEIMPYDSNYILCKRKIALLDRSGKIFRCGERDNRLDVERKDIHKLPLSISWKDILNSNGNLSLLCECTFSTGLEFETIERTNPEIPTAFVDLNTPTAAVDLKTPTETVGVSKNIGNTLESFSAFPSALEDIKSLYMNQCLTDVELKTETKLFPAHKIILCARSPVFQAMLSSDMREKFNNCIQVEDLDDDIVQQLLLFLYSDNIDNLQWNSAVQLYYAADKYQIGRLKELCSSFLEENLTTTNAGELLILADRHNDTDLKKVVEDFILVHEEQVFGSKEWEKLIETHPMLVIKTMHLKYKRKNEAN